MKRLLPISLTGLLLVGCGSEATTPAVVPVATDVPAPTATPTPPAPTPTVYKSVYDPSADTATPFVLPTATPRPPAAWCGEYVMVEDNSENGDLDMDVLSLVLEELGLCDSAFNIVLIDGAPLGEYETVIGGHANCSGFSEYARRIGENRPALEITIHPPSDLSFKPLSLERYIDGDFDEFTLLHELYHVHQCALNLALVEVNADRFAATSLLIYQGIIDRP